MKIYKTRLWITFIGIMSVLFISSVVTAATIDTDGDIFYGNSWGQLWGFDTTGIYQIEAFITDDIGSENVDFELGAGFGCLDGDGLGCFSEGGWNGSIINPAYALATGPSNTIAPFYWGTLFTGNPANQNFTLEYLFSISGYGIYPAQFHWDGTGWNNPVPEPTTMFLLGTGLVGVAGAARRKKKNQA